MVCKKEPDLFRRQCPSNRRLGFFRSTPRYRCVSSTLFSSGEPFNGMFQLHPYQAWSASLHKALPNTFSIIRCSKYTVKPSFNQKSSQVSLVTKFPDHECASSCAIKATKASITSNNGRRRKRQPSGFPCHQTGKLGGKHHDVVLTP